MHHHVVIVASSAAIIIIKGGTAGTFGAAFPVDWDVQQSYLYFMF
jgi:hypothetical protein